MILFLINYLAWEEEDIGRIGGFHLIFPMMIAFTLETKVPVWRLCQLPNMSILISGTREMTTRSSAGHFESLLAWCWPIFQDIT